MDSKTEGTEPPAKKPRQPRKPKEKKEPIKLPKRPKSYASTPAHRAGSERWNKKNKEPLKGYMKTYYERNKDRIKAQKKQFRDKKKTEKNYYKVLIELKQEIPEYKDFRDPTPEKTTPEKTTRPYVWKNPVNKAKPKIFCKVCSVPIVEEFRERHLYSKMHVGQLDKMKWMDILAYGGVELKADDK